MYCYKYMQSAYLNEWTAIIQAVCVCVCMYMYIARAYIVHIYCCVR